MDLYSIVGSAKPEVTFSSDVRATSFAGGPHVNDGRNGGEHTISTRVHNPAINLPPPPPPAAVPTGKSSIINVILGVSSCEFAPPVIFCSILSCFIVALNKVDYK